MDKRYSEVHKKKIQGDDCCPFWRIKYGGSCAALPAKGQFKCPADREGNGCCVFKS